MKYILALAASLALAGTAGASVSLNPVAKQAVATTHTESEVAQGRNRDSRATPQRDKNTPSGGKTIFG
ncbi:hypothetical protein ASC97_25040 [Rhizobium sp. Root1203]|jgi:hypothetical protein|uniref:hypothetical protein n=1 Tax=Rhizobium sp. Root1203 TaxID=1736427 RepID=UPI00070D237A|nr:hypothetical protein [Rhizobium sp. Root1203]KQV26933.1 hypothetical protein ASC97_25040 [Rhizobium sp. Root1203]